MSRWRLEDLYIGDYVSASKTGKTIGATATAKVGSNKITIKTKKLTKGKTYVLQDCYYGGWLDSKKGGNKKISFKAK